LNDFVNLKQGKMSVKGYALKFNQLSSYASELVSSIRARIKKFISNLSQYLILESKAALLNKDMDISRLLIYMQQVEEEKKKQAKF